jgi:predicted TIM-barrel fold metal-dependent hydrolase
MTMPTGIGIVDCMIGFKNVDVHGAYDFFRPLLKDRQSNEEFQFPVEYMFKDVPDGLDPHADAVDETLREMDRFGIEMGLIGVGDETGKRAVKLHPDRFIPSASADGNKGMQGVHEIKALYEEFGVKAVSMFPAGCFPQIPINDAKWYPTYAKCAELGIPVFICAGVPGPRFPMAAQKVELLDEVCWYFPELTIVTRHGCEPWQALAVKLMLKWPNLYYSTSAFAPKHYPKEIIDYANTRGADKIIYAGYFPMGLSLERIFTDMPNVPFKDEVWPKFLRQNARKVLKLDE